MAVIVAEKGELGAIIVYKQAIMQSTKYLIN